MLKNINMLTITGCRDGQQVTKIMKYNRYGCLEGTSYSDWGNADGWTEWLCVTNVVAKATEVTVEAESTSSLNTHLPNIVKSMTIISITWGSVVIDGESTTLHPWVSYTWNQGTNNNMNISDVVLGSGDYSIIWEQEI